MIAIYSLMSVAFLFWLVFYLYNEYRVDSLRQSLFEVRDRFFDEARVGRVAFDATAYRNTRLMLNGMIRFGHRLSLSSIVATRMTTTKDVRSFVLTSFNDASFSEATEAERALCEKYLNEAHLVIARHLLTSPTLWLCFVPIISVVLTHRGVNAAAAVVRRWKRSFAALDQVALKEGRLA